MQAAAVAPFEATAIGGWAQRRVSAVKPRTWRDGERIEVGTRAATASTDRRQQRERVQAPWRRVPSPVRFARTALPKTESKCGSLSISADPVLVAEREVAVATCEAWLPSIWPSVTISA